jgi:uroporphyrinogen decarboxylase
VLNNEKPDRLPIDIWYTAEIENDLKKHFNVTDEIDLYKAMEIDKIVWIFPEYTNPSDGTSSGSQVGAQKSTSRTAWGVPLKTIHSGKAVYQEFGQAPLKNYNTAESLNDYPYWPDPDNFKYDLAKQNALKVSQDYVTMGPWISFFEVYCQMRGLEQSLMDLMTEPDFANALLDKIEDCQTKMLKKYLEKLGENIDMVFISDDMGMQQSLLVAPDIWEKYFKQRMTRWCSLIHSYGKKVFYHSDGAVDELIPGLIETGIDILNPIQHVCKGMEMPELKKKFGQKVVFHGGVDNQSVLPFGTAKEVKAETKNCLETLGSDGKGYIVCSCHNIQAGTPVKNVLAMVETVHYY